MTNDREETHTFEGQVYRDEMMDGEVKVTAVDEFNVTLRDTDLLESHGEEGGSPYPWPMWKENKEEGRFSLIEDVDDLHADEEDPDDGSDPNDGGEGQSEEEETVEESDNSEGEELSPEDFSQQDALSW